MALDVTLDFFGLLRPSTGTTLVRRAPILDTMIYALGASGILPVYVGYTAPTSDQNVTAWLLPQNPSWAGPGQIMLWDSTVPGYVPATPALFVELLNNIGALVTEGVGAPASIVGIPGSLYLQIDNGKVWYKNAAGIWTVFQTAIANIGTYILGHGGPGDPLDVNLAALEAQLKIDLADTIAVSVSAPITGNGKTATPLGLDIAATVADIIANGGLDTHVAVAVDGTTIGGTGKAGAALHVIPAGLNGAITVAVDGTTITGNGTTANPLVSHGAAFAGLTGVTAPLQGIGTSGSPLNIDITTLAADLADKVPVAVDGSTITGNGTTASPLVAHNTGSGTGVVGSSVSCYNDTSSVSTPIPGFPSGAPASLFSVAYNSGVISSTAYNSGTNKLTVGFAAAMADTNYQIEVIAFLDNAEGQGNVLSPMDAGAIDGGNFSTTGFTIDTSSVTGGSVTFPIFFYVRVLR